MHENFSLLVIMCTTDDVIGLNSTSALVLQQKVCITRKALIKDIIGLNYGEKQERFLELYKRQDVLTFHPYILVIICVL